MTVGELAAALRLLSPDVQVLMSKDPEGNDYRVLYETALYDEGDTEDMFEGTNADEFTGARALVLWPY